MELSDFKSNPRTQYLALDYERLLRDEEDAKALLVDESMRTLAEEELSVITPQKEAL